MRVLIQSSKIVIGTNVLEYYPYYFAIWKDTEDHRLTAKSVLAQWATALASLSSRGSAVYLPYYLNDQSCKYLKAELNGEDIVLKDLLVSDAGYAMDLDDLSPVMYSEPKIIDSWVDIDGHIHDSAPKLFGRYKAEELIRALEDAEIAAEEY